LQLLKVVWQPLPPLPVNLHDSWLIGCIGLTWGQHRRKQQSYGGTYNQLKVFLPKLGVTTRFGRSESQHELVKGVEDATDNKTRAVYVESIGNPRYDVADLEAIAEVSKRKGLPLIVSEEAISIATLPFYGQLSHVRWTTLSVRVVITFVPSITEPILSFIPPPNGLVVMAQQSEALSSMLGNLIGVPMLIVFQLWLRPQLVVMV